MTVLPKFVAQAHPHISLDVVRDTCQNIWSKRKNNDERKEVDAAAPTSRQGEENFYNHSHCNIMQLPTITTTPNDKLTIACVYSKNTDARKTGKSWGPRRGKTYKEKATIT